MLWRMAIAVLVVATLANTSRAADEFPYTAFINADEVNVRSGPGDNYYPVLKLDRGTKVEIYRHDPGGWYAVRPPEGSFSWVSAEFIKTGQGRHGVIAGDRVVARVGSVFSDVRDVIQVRLDRGEEVEIIEAKRFNSGPAAQTWYKISAPAGEFRWIAGKYIDREQRVAVPRDPSPRNNMILARLSRQQVDDNGADDEVRPAQRPSDRQYDAPTAGRQRNSRWEDPPAADYTARTESPRTDPLPPVDRWSDRRASDRGGDLGGDREGDRLESDEASVAPLDDRGEPLRSPPPVTAMRSQSQPLVEQLDDMDLELSAMVANEPTTWNFRDLHGRAESALSQSQSAVERGKARVLLSKLARFEDIRQRYVSVMDVRGQVDRRNRELASNARTSRPFSDDPRFDGVGKLAQVMPGKPGTPRYALLDETGEVRYYITPAPGVNLRNYLGHQIGVSGTLGFLPDQQRQHVTARHIVPMDDASNGGTRLR